MERPRRILLILLITGLVVGGGLAIWTALALKDLAMDPLFTSGERQIINVAAGTSFTALTVQLRQRGWIEHPRILRLYGRLTGKAVQIKAGQYAVEPGMTALQLLERMLAGAVVRYSFTIVEGWTFHELLQAIESSDALRHTLSADGSVDVMARLGHPGQDPEGRFLPETYRFPGGTTDIAFLERAYEAMQRVLQAEWAQRAEGLPLESPYEALILASIVEKESALPKDRRRIAGVFIRRLEIGMRLQADPTIIYALGPDFDGDIGYSDLRIDSPYNTYKHEGLPPTPIALPGRSSIAAVLHPAEGDALYFVARGDGRHEFSATLAEHHQAVRRYQLQEQ